VTAELVRGVYGVEAEITEAAGQRVLVPRAEAVGPVATGPTTTTGRTR